MSESDVYFYDRGTLRIGGAATPVTDVRMQARAPLFVTPDIRFDAPLSAVDSIAFDRFMARVTAHLSFKDGLRAEPGQRAGNVRVALPLLGPVDVPVYVEGRTLRQVPSGQSATMTMVPEPKAWRRAVSMAVQSAICAPRRREYVALAVRLSQDGREVLRMANGIVGRWAGDRGRYHGERKQRRAMRRLLRAAGVTRLS